MLNYENYQNRLTETKQQLDQVSDSFCIAKWKQVTMHLQNGHTHSCHHPKTHAIPLSELKHNIKSLHNTQYKKIQRKMMLEGQRPQECDYCWRVEDSTENSFSDRVYKSADNWAKPYLEEIKNKHWDDNVDPSYVEVNFSNVCNFKCSYCAPHISSQWMEEIEKFGPYPTDDRFNNLEWIKQQNQMPIPNREHNPYVEAFWQWWPSMYTKLQHFRITGGEPLLSRNTFQVLDYIIDNPNPNLEFSINTNMNPPDEIFEKFLARIQIIIEKKLVKKFKLFTSAEAHGQQCNYVRFGMDYDKWLSNIHKVYQAIPDIEFTIMSTYNILSIHSYPQFLDDILQIKRKFGSADHDRNPMLLDIPYLRFPQHQTIFMADRDMVDLIYQQVTQMYRNLEYPGWAGTANRGFYEHEADKLKRIYEMAHQSMTNKNQFVDVNRRNFIKFVNEHDRRRGTDFLKTFPDFEKAYTEWSLL
jgi:organic radical activating enzyme